MNWVFLTCSILSAKIDPLVCVNLVLWNERNKYFLYFFLERLFFAMLGIQSTPLFWWLNWTALCTLSKSRAHLTTFSPLKKCLKNLYWQSMCWWFKRNASNFRRNPLIFPFSMRWYLQVGREQILFLWLAMQYCLLTVYFSYVFWESKKPFFENFPQKLVITCDITAVIWFLNCFLKKWTRMTELLFFAQPYPERNTIRQCPKKERISIHGKFTQQWPYNESSCENDQKRRVYK